jgi:hypothetical protein
MKTLLTSKFEFPPANVLVLTDEKATHAGIVAAFKKHLIANTQRGDIVVFHYSGHGSQMKDVSGDELDGLDETIVPHDSRDPAGKVFDISDDEINSLLQELSKKTQNITFIFDSCNSGTVTRGANKKSVSRRPLCFPRPRTSAARQKDDRSARLPNRMICGRSIRIMLSFPPVSPNNSLPSTTPAAKITAR